MEDGWRVGRIAGTEVRVAPSLVVIAGIVVYQRWVDFANPGIFPGTTVVAAGALAVLFAALFFGSVLVHELGHATLAKMRHIEVDGITLWMFGGATHARVDSRGPFDEFIIAVVGPGTSFALGAAFVALSHALPIGQLRLVLNEIGRINVILAVFNVAPGFPLDGGRVLRSIVWAVTGNFVRATVAAARVGQVFGAGCVALAVASALFEGNAFVDRFGIVGAVWLGIIGVILLQAATATIAQERRIRTLTQTLAGSAMRPPPPAVPADMTVGQARATYLEGRTGAFPVFEAGRLIGFVSAASIDGTWSERPVREVATSPEAAITVLPSDPISSVLDRLHERKASFALVMDDGRLVGVLNEQDAEDLLRAGQAGS